MKNGFKIIVSLQPSSSGFETSFDLSNKLNGSSVSGGAADFDVNNGVGEEAEVAAAAEQTSRILG